MLKKKQSPAQRRKRRERKRAERLSAEWLQTRNQLLTRDARCAVCRERLTSATATLAKIQAGAPALACRKHAPQPK